MEKQKIICDNCKEEVLNTNWQRDNLTYLKEEMIEVVYCDECKCPCGGIFNKDNLICNKCGVDKLVLNKYHGERCLECGYLIKNCECENLNNCRCCKGICDCEYSCEHPHNTDFEEFTTLSKKLSINGFRTDEWFNENIWEDDLNKSEIVELTLNEVSKDVKEFIKILKEKYVNVPVRTDIHHFGKNDERKAEHLVVIKFSDLNKLVGDKLI